MNRRMLVVWLCVCAAGAQTPDAPVWKDLKFRMIGPYRGGRVVAVAGVPSQPNVYYFGAVGGGVWKTVDGGASWNAVSDGSPMKTSSVGAMAVAESDPNIIWAGMGEACIRGNASHGDGVYKSTDAGQTWKHMGLAETRHIGAVRIHPRDPNTVYVAALGHQFAANDERGVYRTTDGGKTWKQVLTRGNKAGAVDLILDPTNPSILYAAFWEVYRTPWSLESGGANSGLWKSTDGGDTWQDLTKNPGMPKGPLGRIGVAVSGANPQRVWAIVEAAEGGVFRSENGGKTWARVNESRNLRQRAWYYTHIYADPKSADTVYVLNTGFYKSIDGGKTYTGIAVPHGDNHALWIDPNDPQRMINGNDGGANVSTTGGRIWTRQDNQPTAQFYRVALDNDFPYNIYGAQQDNTTVRIASRSNGGSIGVREWWDVGGGESGWIAPWPKDSNVVFAGSYGGLLTRYDHRTGGTSNVTVWPDNPMGYGAEGMKYRFQWNFPLLFSPHDPNRLYAGGSMLFASTDAGQSWKAISPDLTRNDKSKQGPSGGPITKDNTGVEYYDTIFTVAESPVKAGVIWTGSDDGLVQLTTDGGGHWSNVTPKELPEWNQVNSIEASPHDAATAYVAATMYKSDDFRPYLYRTHDYGKTWTKIVDGLPADSFTRVIREDPNRKGLLFAGTETGLFVSFDDGAHWQAFQLNLPVTPVTDIALHKRDRDLVIATQGRSFYVLDDVPLLYQAADAVKNEAVHLFTPEDPYRPPAGGGFGGGSAGPAGQNAARGAVVYYWLKDKPKGEVTLEFLDGKGALVRRISSKSEEKSEAGPARPAAEDDDDDDAPRPATAPKAPANAGLNRLVWDLRYADATKFPNMILWAGSVRGPMAIPGEYTVKLSVDGVTQTAKFTLLADPRLKTTAREYAQQLELALQIRDKLTRTHDAILEIRDVRKQLDEYATRAEDKKVIEAAKELAKKLTAVEEQLYQTKNQSGQDPLNYPIRLNNKLAALGGVVQANDAGPTQQSRIVFEELASGINAQLKKLDGLVKDDLAAFNALVRSQGVPAVIRKSQK